MFRKTIFISKLLEILVQQYVVVILTVLIATALSAKDKQVIVFVDFTLRLDQQAVAHSLENSVLVFLDNLKVKGYRQIEVIVLPINAYTLTSPPIIRAKFSGRSDAISRSKRIRAIKTIQKSLAKSIAGVKKDSELQRSSDLLSIIRRSPALFHNPEAEKELVVISDFFQFSSELKLLPELQHTKPEELISRINANNGWNQELRNVNVSLCIPSLLRLPVESIVRLRKFWVKLFKSLGAAASFDSAFQQT